MKEQRWTKEFSFNGAATFRLRKASRLRAGASFGLGFNGAATFRLRKAYPEEAAELTLYLLQWGRNLSVAEGS